ncbi:MAG TPA: hypothetical protein VMT55_04710 [Candidatus Sulfotelmatobacter sp.]|nr:hypothetical protein [Candidatus Sulfotelmatobacter sp.]
MKSSNKQGLNLIEAIITIVLLAVILSSISVFIITALRAWVLISGRESAVGLARGAMNRMTAEIRRTNTLTSISTPLASSKLQFQDISNTTITFSQEGTNLRRNGDILLTGLATPTGLSFTYLGPTSETITDPNAKQNVRSIRVWLSLSSGSQRTTLESSARVRNL